MVQILLSGEAGLQLKTGFWLKLMLEGDLRPDLCQVACNSKVACPAICALCINDIHGYSSAYDYVHV